jgi:transcriptional regulator with XRE-family HTH domain
MHVVPENGPSQFHKARAVDERMGRRLRGFRLLNSLSQEQLSDLLGITCDQLRDYEDGVSRIGASCLIRISKVMNVPLRQLYGSIDRGFDPLQSRSETSEMSDAVELFKAFRLIANPVARRVLIEMAGVLSAVPLMSPQAR